MDLKCIYPLCKQYVKPGSDMCFSHHIKFKAKDLKVTKPIAKMSAKRKELQNLYVGIVKNMLKENPNCQIKSPACEGKASGLHHKIKRSEKNLCEASNLIRACSKCNLYVEENDAWGREKGFVKSKFKVDESKEG